MTTLRAGAGRCDISPAKGTYLAGYGHPFRTCKSVRDPLSTTLLLLEDADTRVLLVTLDALSIHEDIVKRIRGEIADDLGVKPSHIFIACSHSHASPVLSQLEESSEEQRAHIDMVVRATGEAARQAREALQEVSMYIGRGLNTIAVNRRETNAKGETVIGVSEDGSIDPDLLVMQVRSAEGSVISTLVNLACHPTCLSPKHRVATAAWPGEMRRLVEAHTGAPVLFIQGATGDLNPNHTWGKHDIDAMVRLGQEAGQATLMVLESMKEVQGVPLSAEHCDVNLPIAHEVGPKGRPLDHLDALRRHVPLPRFAAQWLLNRCYPWRSRQEESEEGPVVPMEVQVLRLGEVALMGWAAEVFHAHALAMKASSPAEMTFFGAYSNGMIGYLATREEVARGGYEVEVSPYFYRLQGRLDPGAGERATSQSNEILKRLFTHT